MLSSHTLLNTSVHDDDWRRLYTTSTVYRARQLARHGQIITVYEIATRRVGLTLGHTQDE